MTDALNVWLYGETPTPKGDVCGCKRGVKEFQRIDRDGYDVYRCTGCREWSYTNPKTLKRIAKIDSYYRDIERTKS